MGFYDSITMVEFRQELMEACMVKLKWILYQAGISLNTYPRKFRLVYKSAKICMLKEHNYNYNHTLGFNSGSNHDGCMIFQVSNIFYHLSGILQDHFVYIVSQFLYIPWDYEQKQAAVRTSLQNDSNCTPSITVAAAETFESHMIDFLKGQV